MALTRLGPNQSVNLTSNVTGTLPIANGGTAITSGFVNGVPNSPAFEALTDTTTSITNDTTTKMTFASTVFNEGSGWDTSNNKFLPTTAGKYFVYGCVEAYGGGDSTLTDTRPMIYKNGSMVRQTPWFFKAHRQRYNSSFIYGTYDLNGSSDYIEMYFSVNSTSTPTIYEKYFGAYRIIG